MAMEMIKQLPPGVRFCPKPPECIIYLACKVTGQPLPYNGVILDHLDPYNVKHLPHIFLQLATQNKPDLYLFTKLSKKGKLVGGGSTNVNRTVGRGTWHANQTSHAVTYQGRPIGKVTKLCYQEKGSEYDRQFLMTEYTLPQHTSLQYDPFKHYVLCHIVKKVRKNSTPTTFNYCDQVPAAAYDISSDLPEVLTADSVSSSTVEFHSPPLTDDSCYSCDVAPPTYLPPLATAADSRPFQTPAPPPDHDYLPPLATAADSPPFQTPVPPSNDYLPLATAAADSSPFQTPAPPADDRNILDTLLAIEDHEWASWLKAIERNSSINQDEAPLLYAPAPAAAIPNPNNSLRLEFPDSSQLSCEVECQPLQTPAPPADDCNILDTCLAMEEDEDHEWTSWLKDIDSNSRTNQDEAPTAAAAIPYPNNSSRLEFPDTSPLLCEVECQTPVAAAQDDHDGFYEFLMSPDYD